MNKKAFKLGALFASKSGDTDIKKEHINGEGYPVVSSGNDNAGILGCSDIEACVIPKNTITVDMFGNVYYRDFDYKMVTHARVFALLPNGFSLDEKTGLYFATSLVWLSHVFSYNNMCSYKKIKDMEIEIPVIESPDPGHEYTADDIDWQYMRKYIAELEQRRIAELNAYLIATGLDDYELTDEDKEMLSSSTRQIFKSFYLKDIFGSEPIRGARLTKEHRISGNIPLITAGEQNEGVAEYISNQENQTLSNMLTIDMFGNCFYRDYLYKSDDNILSFGLNGKSTEEMLYIASIINSICKKQYNYARQYRKDSYLETTIPLPVIESPDPDHKYTVDDIDFDYMERYIRATEKSVIADVVRYKNKVIEETKKTVNAG